MKMNPKVYLVGAGPGDPDLLTVKALRLIQGADVVVYDRLVSREILALIPSGTKKVYVGKASGKHHMNQDAINELLLNLARSGRMVVRLKGGDPFTFGRGSEEAQYLVANRIGYEVVPGITAAAACSAYAGIPLTHRGIARSVQMIAGHCKSDEELDLNWKGIANPDSTLVFYMGLANVRQIRDELIRAGLDRQTPAAIVENGTLEDQRSFITTLENLPEMVTAKLIQAPAMLIIGKVVQYASELAWFPAHTGEEYVADESQQLGA